MCILTINLLKYCGNKFCNLLYLSNINNFKSCAFKRQNILNFTVLYNNNNIKSLL